MFVYLCCVKYYSVSKTVSNILHTKRESKCLNWSSTPINRTLKLITLCENKRNQPVSSIFTYHPLHCLKSSFRHHLVDNDHFVRTHECFLFGIIGNKKKHNSIFCWYLAGFRSIKLDSFQLEKSEVDIWNQELFLHKLDTEHVSLMAVCINRESAKKTS